MGNVSFANPAFATFAIVAGLMILKTIGMAWLPVWKMSSLRSGYRSPEDARRTPRNPDPRPGQTEPIEAEDRFYGYVPTRLVHCSALARARSHYTRATFWPLAGTDGDWQGAAGDLGGTRRITDA